MANDSDSSGIKKMRENVESQKVNKTFVASGEIPTSEDPYIRKTSTDSVQALRSCSVFN